MTRLPQSPSSTLLSRRGLLLAGTVSAASLVGCSQDASEPGPSETAGPAESVAAAEDVVLDDATKGRLDELLDAGFAGTGVVGLAGAMWIGDQEWSRETGVRDVQTQEPYSADDLVRCASITKSFCATAVLQLVDQGALALEDTLEQFVPGIINGDRITVEMMLGMRSGIYDFTSNTEFNAMFEADPAMAWSDEQTIAVIKANQPVFEPDAKVLYADSNYALLGAIMRQVTGSTPAQTITANVIVPLGLTATSFPTAAAMPEPHPTAYVPVLVGGDPSAPFDNAANPPRVVNEVNPDVASTAGAMISSLQDLRTWGTELGDGTLLTPESQQRRVAASKRLDGQQVNLGYGLGIVTLNDFLGHDGAIYGYSTIVLRRPQTDTTLVLVANESTNSTTPTFAIAYSIIAALFPDQAT